MAIFPVNKKKQNSGIICKSQPLCRLENWTYYVLGWRTGLTVCSVEAERLPRTFLIHFCSPPTVPLLGQTEGPVIDKHSVITLCWFRPNWLEKDFSFCFSLNLTSEWIFPLGSSVPVWRCSVSLLAQAPKWELAQQHKLQAFSISSCQKPHWNCTWEMGRSNLFWNKAQAYLTELRMTGTGL